MCFDYKIFAVNTTNSSNNTDYLLYFVLISYFSSASSRSMELWMLPKSPNLLLLFFFSFFFLLHFFLILLFLLLPGVCDVRGLSPSLSAPGQATEEPAEERKQRRGGVSHEELDGWMDRWREGGMKEGGREREREMFPPSGPPEAALVSITRREEEVILTDDIPQHNACSFTLSPLSFFFFLSFSF